MSEVAIRNICIVEDEPELVEALTEYLELSDYSVISFNSAEEFFENSDPNFRGLYLIDWNLPGEPGIKIVEEIRSKNKFSPIFMISAFTKNEEIVTGLKAGADDYITKPYSMEELLVRVNNATIKLNSIESEVDSSNFKLLPEAATFIKDGKTYNLTHREFIIFHKLHEEKNNPVSREELIECFAKEEKMTIRNVDVHVFSLRKKIKEANLHIETVWGHGYKLNL